MAATMEAAMFIMINMYGYVCANVCVDMHEYVHNSWTDSTHPNLHPIPSPPRKGGTPWKQYKFNKSWTNWDKSILFAYLESV